MDSNSAETLCCAPVIHKYALPLSGLVTVMQYFRLPPSHWQVDTDHLIPSNLSTPFYYVDSPRWLPHLSDESLTLLAPIVTYWSIILLYLLFLFVHSPKGNHRALRGQTVRLVVEIQFVQTIFGWLWLTRYGKRGVPHDPAGEMRAIGRRLGAILPTLLGKANAQEFLNRNGQELIHFTYWWAIPVARQFAASFIVDAWQAFLRFLHIDRYLYADVHAFLFDTVGVCLVCSLSGITYREAIVFLILSTLQTLGERPRRTLPRSSLHPCVPIDRETTIRPGEHGSVCPSCNLDALMTC
ncbi:hypothetical protein JB92DRAFT_2950294 [Gautieria morchelliformis]|nr:hypothetical protein JB92DRAFT_2950294 [Gautieria morchelliformis]